MQKLRLNKKDNEQMVGKVGRTGKILSLILKC